MGKEKGTDNKNSKSLRVKDLLFLFFFGLLGAQVGKEKGTDNKKTLRDLLFLLSLAFWGPRWARRRGQTTKIANP